MNSTWEALYEALDFHNGALLPAIDEPSSDIDLVDWLDKGEWLAAAKRAGADKVFFVKNNPIAIFAECGSGDLDKIRAFNHAGCLGRPRLLFLVSPGEISVLDLAQKPISLSVDSCPDRHFVPPRMGSYPPFYGKYSGCESFSTCCSCLDRDGTSSWARFQTSSIRNSPYPCATMFLKSTIFRHSISEWLAQNSRVKALACSPMLRSDIAVAFW